MCVARFIDVFATGLVAGAFLTGSFALHPAAATLDAPSHLLLRQQLIHRLSKLMPPLMLLPVAACITAFMFCRISMSWEINTLSGVLSLATIGITIAVNVPLNRCFARWSPSALPCDWERCLQRWNAAHSARTAAAVAAFLCAIFAGS